MPAARFPAGLPYRRLATIPSTPPDTSRSVFPGRLALEPTLPRPRPRPLPLPLPLPRPLPRPLHAHYTPTTRPPPPPLHAPAAHQLQPTRECQRSQSVSWACACAPARGPPARGVRKFVCSPLPAWLGLMVRGWRPCAHTLPTPPPKSSVSFLADGRPRPRPRPRPRSRSPSPPPWPAGATRMHVVILFSSSLPRRVSSRRLQTLGPRCAVEAASFGPSVALCKLPPAHGLAQTRSSQHALRSPLPWPPPHVRNGNLEPYHYR